MERIQILKSLVCKRKVKMEVNAFIAGKENILKRKNANLTKCRSHKILQHLAVVFEKC
jgi:hypothetical protein